MYFFFLKKIISKNCIHLYAYGLFSTQHSLGKIKSLFPIDFLNFFKLYDIKMPVKVHGHDISQNLFYRVNVYNASISHF